MSPWILGALGLAVTLGIQLVAVASIIAGLKERVRSMEREHEKEDRERTANSAAFVTTMTGALKANAEQTAAVLRASSEQVVSMIQLFSKDVNREVTDLTREVGGLEQVTRTEIRRLTKFMEGFEKELSEQHHRIVDVERTAKISRPRMPAMSAGRIQTAQESEVPPISEYFKRDPRRDP